MPNVSKWSPTDMALVLPFFPNSIPSLLQNLMSPLSLLSTMAPRLLSLAGHISTNTLFAVTLMEALPSGTGRQIKSSTLSSLTQNHWLTFSSAPTAHTLSLHPRTKLQRYLIPPPWMSSRNTRLIHPSTRHRSLQNIRNSSLLEVVKMPWTSQLLLHEQESLSADFGTRFSRRKSAESEVTLVLSIPLLCILMAKGKWCSYSVPCNESSVAEPFVFSSIASQVVVKMVMFVFIHLIPITSNSEAIIRAWILHRC